MSILWSSKVLLRCEGSIKPIGLKFEQKYYICGNKNSNKGCGEMKYKCSVCGYVYDDEDGDIFNDIPPGTKWEDLPDNWKCPVCGAPKERFVQIGF